MRQFLLGLGVSAVFMAGCVAGASSWAVPRASAARIEEQRWAYFCFEAATADDVHFKANAAGARGWEMVSAASSASGAPIWCFRQPRP
jgi:hypothetical protein